MSDWQVGDLAMCVDVRPYHSANTAPSLLREGRAYVVSGLGPDSYMGGRRYPTLILRDIRNDLDHTDGFAAARFRKIRPDEHEACEPEFVTLLKRTKRKVAA